MTIQGRRKLLTGSVFILRDDIEVKALFDRLARNQRGQGVLAVVLVLVILAALILGPLLGFMGTGLKEGQMHESKAQELYAADSGVEDALNWLIQGKPTGQYWGWDWNETTGEGQKYFPDPINDRTVNVFVEKVASKNYKITSTATSDDGGGTTVESYVRFTGVMFGAAVTVTNGDLYIEDTYIDGDVLVSGDFSSEDSTVTGIASENQTIEFTPLNPEPYKDEALNGTVLEGDQLIDEDTSWDTPVYIEGDLKIEAGVTLTLNGTVWVEGSIGGLSMFVEGLPDNHTSINGTGNLIAEQGNIRIEYLRIETTNMPLLWAVHGDIERVETNQYMKVILYAPEGNIEIETTDVLYGVVFAETVDLMENCSVVYPTEYYDLLGDGELEILTYTLASG